LSLSAHYLDLDKIIQPSNPIHPLPINKTSVRHQPECKTNEVIKFAVQSQNVNFSVV